MTTETGIANKAVKGRYAAPQLTTYGSVRNLTGGSAGMKSDAMSTTMA